MYALPFYSVEAIYFHPEIIHRVAKLMADIRGDDASTLREAALAVAIAAIAGHTERLSRNIAKKSIRKLIVEQLPNDDELLRGETVTLANDADSILERRKKELDTAVSVGDWAAILTKCPVRESSALAEISTKLGFGRVQDYERAVRQLLASDDQALDIVRRLFDDLYGQLND